MKKEDFAKRFGRHPFVLDGAAGTKLMEMGMPTGVCPELWACENIDTVKQMHTKYIDAGADSVFAFTFGGNEQKLAEYGLQDKMHEINLRLCEAACEAADGRALVGGDISPFGDFIQPFGDFPFEEAVRIYYNQARVLADAGADFIAIETMLDVQNARAAIIGAQQACSLPIYVTLAFDESGHTLTGSDAKAVATTLCALGIDALGANCGIGPDAMLDLVAQLNRYSSVPVVAKPNAGLPTGDTMPVEDYAQAVASLVDAGASAVGGCCGTSYEHIARIHELVQNKPVSAWGKEYSEKRLSSLCATATIQQGTMSSIGERINPTGKKRMQAALQAGDMEYMVNLANEQKSAGANILDINAGMAGIDEAEKLSEVMLAVAGRVDIPLCIDSANPDAMERALRAYPGRALVNSVSAESSKAERLFPLIAKYGCMYVALPIADSGVPQSAQERILVVQQLLETAETYGISRSRAIIDALALSIGSEPDAGRVALDVIEWCAHNNLNCMMGVSNISFGLPERAAVNAAMLTAGMARGMNAAIVNVCDPGLRASLEAARAIVYAGDISRYTALYTSQTTEKGLTGAVIAGDKGRIDALVQAQLDAGVQPGDIVQQEIIPALDTIGELFSEKKAFLPQLMASAEAAKLGFAKLEPLMLEESEAQATAVIATVKGDIHDIGKNIVALMLRNHGFRVVDLGRDVPNEEILDAAEREKADIIGLSALITTTMPRMGECAELMRERGLKCALMIGGAVVTDEYAKQIGALYSKDAAEAVEVAKKATQGGQA